MKSRTAKTSVALGMLVAVATACTAPPAEVDRPSFALTSADIVVGEEGRYPVNLVFLAGERDPIWTELTGIVLPRGASIGPGQFEVIRGEDSSGYRLGNVSFDLAIPDNGIAFTSIGLIYENGTEPVTTPVGSWTLREAPLRDFAGDRSKAEVVSMGGCTGADIPVPADVASLELFSTESDEVEVEEATLNEADSTISVTVKCDGEADFHIVSPVVHYRDAVGDDKMLRLTPIAIGFQDIDDTDLDRIRRR